MIQQLPLHQRHSEKGARFGAFGPWEVPLYYRSILEEHETVRLRAGLFDISHMGEFYLRGSGSAEFLQNFLTRDVTAMSLGKALYMPLLNGEGKILDDIILYRLASEEFLFIVNASNTQKDFEWLSAHVPAGVTFENASERFGLLALQGPKSSFILERALSFDGKRLSYYSCQPYKDGIISRTGYTGEDGYEIMVGCEHLEILWDRLNEAGSEDGLTPVGFGARDTLRIEASMPLYGHELSEDVTPLEAGLGWAVDFQKKSFFGREALIRQKNEGVTKKLIGFEMIDRGIPREGYEIRIAGCPMGKVTSGTFSPTLKKNIGMGYLEASSVISGRQIEIMIREKPCRAQCVPLPFYRRSK